jgi:hypothetical protein
MEEAQGFRVLLDLEEPKYSIEQIGARVQGDSVTARPSVSSCFWAVL